MALMPETVTPRAGRAALAGPGDPLPRGVRGPVAIAAPVLFAVWALAGFYASLGPALVRNLAGSDVGGLRRARPVRARRRRAPPSVLASTSARPTARWPSASSG